MTISNVPILGIANSGKTSLIRTFQREFKALAKIKPTKGIERSKISLFGRELIVWDFGGQQKYLSKYFNRAELYFSDLEQAYFVVDIQDQKTITSAINYFQTLQKSLAEYSPSVQLYVLLHKFDPGFEKDPATVEYVKTIGQKFSEMAQPLRTKVIETSIFNPISVIHAMSNAVLGNNILASNAGVILSEFVENNNLQDQIEFILLYSEDLVEIGSYFPENVDHETLKAAAKEIFAAFQPKKLKLYAGEFTIESEGIELLAHRIVGDNDQNFYLLVGYKPEKVYNVLTLKDQVKLLLDHVEKLLMFL
ncbi:MAG: ADP-ribosylation factor-like protein [Promethearchaeota archaeon]